MKVAACLFDLDGVLCDTSHFHYIAWKETAQKLGVPFNEEDNHQLKGVSRVGSLQYILDKGGISLSEEDFNQLLISKNDHYISMIKDMDEQGINPGVKELLDELKANNILRAIGSSSKNARMVVDRLGITGYFQTIVDGNDVVNTKPDPEVFLKGATALGVDPSETIVFEDAPKGAQAAIAGGFQCVGVGGNELAGIAHIVVPDLTSTWAALLELLKKSSK